MAIMLNIIRISLLSLLIATTASAYQQPPTQQEMQSIKKVGQILDNLRGDTEMVWPEYEFAKSPLVITFDNGHLYGFNVKNEKHLWDELKVDQRTVLYSDVDHWGALSANMHPAFPIGDQKAYVFRLDLMKKNPVTPFLVLVHERFHQFQFGHFKLPNNGNFGPYEDQMNLENIALMQLEERILLDFLKAPDAEKKDILKDFVAVNTTRRHQISPSSQAWEYDQERMEGLADYVSIKFFDDESILPEFRGQPHLMMLLNGYIRDENFAERAIKWRHYGIGATLGYALDYLQAPHWKQRVEKEALSQVEILERILKLSQNDINTRLTRIKEAYGYTEIRNNAEISMNKYGDKIDHAMNTYDEMDGVEVFLTRPPGQAVAGGGRSQGNYQLPDGSMMAVNDTSSSATEDHQWKIDFKGIPVMFQRGDARLFKIEKEIAIYLDGRYLRLQDLLKTGFNQTFNSIKLEGAMAQFASESHSGRLEITKDGKMAILFDIME